VTNVAFQYHLLPYLWPEIELNDTYWFNGARGRLNQLFLTFDAIIGPYPIPGTRAKAPLWLPNRADAASGDLEPYHAGVQSQSAVWSTAVFLTGFRKHGHRNRHNWSRSRFSGGDLRIYGAVALDGHWKQGKTKYEIAP
jgi:hypothetical protein